MATQKTRNRSLYLAPETAFTTETVTVGDYLPVPAENLSHLTDETAVYERPAMVGRNVSIAGDRGADGASLTLSMPLTGYATAGGDATHANGGNEDVLGHLIQSALGAAGTQQGADIASATAGGIVANTPHPSDQTLVPVYGSGLHSGGVQWRRLSGSAGTYATDRNWIANPTSSEVIYATRYWTGPVVDDGFTLSGYYTQDDNTYLLLGGRPTSMKISASAGQVAMVDFGLSFDSKTRGTVRSVTSIDTFSPERLKALNLEISFGGTTYGASSVEIDFGLSTSPITDSTTANGRSDLECLGADPVITFTPPGATGWEDDFRAGTSGPLSVSFGIGDGTASRINSVCMFCESAQVMTATTSDDGPIMRQSVSLAARWEGLFAATSTDSHYYILSRA